MAQTDIDKKIAKELDYFKRVEEITVPNMDLPTNCEVVEHLIKTGRWLINQLKECWKEIETDDKLLEERNRVVNQFECPSHGLQCIPYALARIGELKANEQVIEQRTKENIRKEIGKLDPKGETLTLYEWDDIMQAIDSVGTK